MKSFFNLSTINHGLKSANGSMKPLEMHSKLIMCEHSVMYNVFSK
jgi:hypothetical protein